MTAPSDLAPLDVAVRAGRVRDAFDRHGCDALLVSDLANIRYLTGFTGSSAVALVRGDRIVLITDGRYRTQAREQSASAGVDPEIVITREVDAHLAPLVADIGRLGLEADVVSWSQHQRWGAALAPTLVAVEGLVLGLRAVKDEGEVDRLDHAAGIADDTLAAVRGELLEGPTEREFARLLEAAMFERGATAPSFETIVASGPNGAKPHHRPSDRVVGSSGDPELVVVDFGATFDGYHSDMTRTLAIGDLTSEQQRMVDVVARSQAAGVAAVRPGVRSAAVDAVCRTIIEDAGWGEAFSHGTGHGIGLVIHESPRVMAESDAMLAPGHCVTVEPGVYLPEHGGVRIEDSVVVTGTGCRRLTGAPYDLAP